LKTDDGPINAGAKVALKAADELLDSVEEPHSTLRVIIDNMIYPITIDVLHKIFSKFGQVLRIVTYMKNGQLHAFIEYNNAVVASAAKNSLNGQNIYNGCCTLRVDFSNLGKLTVKYNNDKTWDYTNPKLPAGDGRSINSELFGGSSGIMLGTAGRMDGMSSGGMMGDNNMVSNKMNVGRNDGRRDEDIGLGAGSDLSKMAANLLGMSGNIGSVGGNMLNLGGLAGLGGNINSLMGGMMSAAGNMSIMSGLLGGGLGGGLMGGVGTGAGGAVSMMGNVGSTGGMHGTFERIYGSERRSVALDRRASSGLSRRDEMRRDRDQDRVTERAEERRGNHHSRREEVRQYSHGAECQTGGCVVLVSNLNETKITPDNIFTLFGVYGNVQRVKILFNKKDSALVEYAEPIQASNAIDNLNKVKWWGKEMRVTPSKHTHIQSAKEGLPEAWLTKDFTDSSLQRYRTPNSKNYRNIFPPSATLHLSNISSSTTEEKLVDLFCEFGRVRGFKFFQKDRKMALIQMSSVEEAITALVELHDYELSPKSHLRVSFTNSVIRD
jgi:RNA recognition motif-containing protein